MEDPHAPENRWEAGGGDWGSTGKEGGGLTLGRRPLSVNLGRPTDRGPERGDYPIRPSDPPVLDLQDPTISR